ncbi:MAG TPA: NAD(P)/FAD-dependent oxidoreductase [Chloroflexi bacterium]|nr:NAD(P)/FAD-dependent oxidoreductase [Chloroflexota bacterium]
MTGERITYDVIVVGGGPAGLMAAGQAAGMGARTLLLEKMDCPAHKLRITGKGRCNLTNVAPMETFIDHFGPSGQFLRQAFYRFFAEDLVAFLAQLSVPTVTERGGRVFPASSDAQDVVDALIEWVQAQGATIQTRAPVEGLITENACPGGVRVTGVRAAPNRTYRADSVIVATGGASYPGTGSTGDGYRLAESVGHTIVPIRPALVPLETAGDVAPRLQGLSLRNVNVRLLIADTERDEQFGEMLFTHFGVSGPIILTLSRQVVDALQREQRVEISIDLKPALDEETLDARILRDFDAHGKRQFRNILKDMLPSKLIPVCADLVSISPYKVAHQITSEERDRLRAWLKDFRLRVTGRRPFAEAIVTAGGVETTEIEPRTMASKLVQGLYFAGEVLDVDADTGGYNLQAAFSTGWLAGRSSAKHRDR